MSVPELIDFRDKKWMVVGKISENHIDDHTKIKKMYDCDLVLKNNQGIYFALNEIIDVEFEDI